MQGWWHREGSSGPEEGVRAGFLGGDILKGWGGRAASWRSLRGPREAAQGHGRSCRGGSGMNAGDLCSLHRGSGFIFTIKLMFKCLFKR